MSYIIGLILSMKISLDTVMEVMTEADVLYQYEC